MNYYGKYGQRRQEVPQNPCQRTIVVCLSIVGPLPIEDLKRHCERVATDFSPEQVIADVNDLLKREVITQVGLLFSMNRI